MTRPLRITHVVNSDQFAGLERYVVEVSAELARRGHDVRVAGGQPAAMQALLPADVPWRPGASTAESLRALIVGGRRDIVHSHLTKADFVSLLAAPMTRAARVSTRHIPAHRGHTRWAQRVAPLVRSRLAVEVAVSSWTSAQLERPSDVVLLNGVPPVPDVGDERDRSVLVAQRLVAEKDTGTALRAWASAGLHERGWRMVVAGRGELRDSLAGQADELGVADSVDFVGFLDDPTEQYRRAAMLLAPAPTEPCGLVIIEAMAHGLPVVAAAAGGNPETIGRCAGAALFPAGNADAAAEQLRRLADDPAERQRYGAAERELQREHYSITAHVDRLERLYRQVVRRHRRTAPRR